MKRVKDIFNATRYKKICLDCFKRKETFDDFFNLKVKSPTLAEQQKIASCLSSLDSMIGSEQSKLDVLKEHKKGLMQQLFPQPSK